MMVLEPMLMLSDQRIVSYEGKAFSVAMKGKQKMQKSLRAFDESGHTSLGCLTRLCQCKSVACFFFYP